MPCLRSRGTECCQQELRSVPTVVAGPDRKQHVAARRELYLADDARSLIGAPQTPSQRVNMWTGDRCASRSSYALLAWSAAGGMSAGSTVVG